MPAASIATTSCVSVHVTGTRKPSRVVDPAVAERITGAGAGGPAAPPTETQPARASAGRGPAGTCVDPLPTPSIFKRGRAAGSPTAVAVSMQLPLTLLRRTPASAIAGTSLHAAAPTRSRSRQRRCSTRLTICTAVQRFAKPEYADQRDGRRCRRPTIWRTKSLTSIFFTATVDHARTRPRRR